MGRSTGASPGDATHDSMRGPGGVSSSWVSVGAWFVVHTVLWIGLVRLVPGDDFVDYDDLGALGTPWVRQFVVALVVVAVLQVIAAIRLGWWAEVWRDDRPAPRWMWIPVAFMGVTIVAQLASNGLSDVPAHYWLGLTVTMLLVGLTEEISFRGAELVMARRLLDERGAWLVSSALFGLFHLPNALLGQDLGPTLVQVVGTAALGSVFYCLRRLSGSLVPCVVLHAVYDWVLIQSNALG